ncbi:MAG: glycosyltransferase [Pseudomonadota bacterium]
MKRIFCVTPSEHGISFVLPVYNGQFWLDEVLDAVLAQAKAAKWPTEIIVVDDGSTDRSLEIVQSKGEAIHLIEGDHRGASAAVNKGIREASYSFVCQVDHDVVLQNGCLENLINCVESDPNIAAAQGYFISDPNDGVWARVSNIVLRQRYARLPIGDVDHVCTGNTLYRTSALHEVGLFDEALGYGYDNDMSYRLISAGHSLVHCPNALSVHRRQPGIKEYFREQYGLGYGRLDLVAKHPKRAGGDQVSGLCNIFHAAFMFVGLGLLLVTGILALLGRSWELPLMLSGSVFGLLALERLLAGALAARRFHDPTAWFFVPAHLIRDLAWALAIVCWILRRCFGIASCPEHSMRRISP